MNAIIIIISATWKFAATFPLAVYVLKMSFLETIIYTNIGGLIGIIISVYLSKKIIYLWDAFISDKLKYTQKRSKIFTKRNRYLVLLKKRYGLPGIVILTPVILSIPVGSFLTTKYFGNDKKSFFYLFLGQVVWSVVYTTFYIRIKTVI